MLSASVGVSKNKVRASVGDLAAETCLIRVLDMCKGGWIIHWRRGGFDEYLTYLSLNSVR